VFYAPHKKSLSNVNNMSAYVAPDYAADSFVPIFDRGRNAIVKERSEMLCVSL
jgi:hypothetical protein